LEEGELDPNDEHDDMPVFELNNDDDESASADVSTNKRKLATMIS
jgi:hypothetical protein